MTSLISALSFNGLARYVSATPFDDYIQIVQGNGRTNVQVDLNGDFEGRDRLKTFAILDGVTAAEVTIDSFVR